MAELPVADVVTRTELTWPELVVEIEKERQHDGYLQSYWISRTMHPQMRPLSRKYWDEIRDKGYVVRDILPAAPDGLVGKPHVFELMPTLSPQTVQHIYYINLMLERLGVRVAEVPHIVEIGGGYGNLARIIRRMGHTGRYDIVDLPEIHELQRQYLDEALPGHGVRFVRPEEVDGGDLLIATFSVSEMPWALRDWWEPKYAGFGRLFMATTRSFCGMDNVDYFMRLADRLGAKFWKDKHRSAWFLCRR